MTDPASAQQKSLEACAAVLLEIVSNVEPCRPRGWHCYPTKYRDAAIVALDKAGYRIKAYTQCQEDTANGV